MEIDVRKIIVATLYTIAKETDRRIISWDNDIHTYMDLLEQKLGVPIKLINGNDINEKMYDALIEPYFEDSKSYIILNTNYHFRQLEGLVDKSLLLDNHTSLINNKEEEKLDEIMTSYRSENNQKYQKNISLDKILDKKPNVKYIKLDGIFKLFMLYYNTTYKKTIKKEQLQTALLEITQIFQSRGIEVEKLNGLNFFRLVYDKNRDSIIDNPNRTFNMKDGIVSLEINNLNEYLKEIKNTFNKETLRFVEEVIAHYVTSPHFENKIYYDERNEKIKGI